MEMEHPHENEGAGGCVHSIHGEFRNVRMMKNGHYLIAYLNRGMVIEYDQDWNEVWHTTNAPSVWQAIRLPNGNTLISGNEHCFAREINPKDEIVWEFRKSRPG